MMHHIMVYLEDIEYKPLMQYYITAFKVGKLQGYHFVSIAQLQD
jgi:hypothetical protein